MLLLTGEPRSGALEYEIEGTVDVQGRQLVASSESLNALQRRDSSFPRNLQPEDFRKVLTTVTNMTYNFRVSARDCQWLIKIEPTIQTREFANYEYAEAGYDGTNVCYVMAAPTGEANDSQGAAIVGARNKAVARVIPGEVPYEMPVIPVLWLAYCSSCYLDGLDNADVKRAIAIHRAAPGNPSSRALLREASWTRSEFPPRLPSALFYLDDGFHLEMSGGVEKKLPLIAPFDQGYVTAKFEAGFTNLGSTSLPLAFRFTEFRPDWLNGRSTNDLVAKKVTSGRAFRLLPTSGVTSYLPLLPTNTPIADGRFRDKGVPLVAYVTNAWLSKGQVATSRDFATTASLADATRKRAATQGRNRWFVRSALIASIVAPAVILAVLLLFRRKKSQQKPT